MRLMKVLVATIVSIAPVAAFAQSADPAPTTDTAPDTHTPAATAAPTPSGQLPPATSDHDPAPPVPTPNVPGLNGDVVEQAGVGGAVGYGRAGVLELGGAAGLTIAQDIRAVNFSPSIGWFLVDNFELSAILDVTNLRRATSRRRCCRRLVEPSFHLPFNRSMFGFVGMGIGAAYVSSSVPASRSRRASVWTSWSVARASCVRRCRTSTRRTTRWARSTRTAPST